MATLSISREYRDEDILLESDLDAIKSSIETFINTTGISDDNIQTGGITGSAKLVDASVTNAKMAADSVNSSQLVASAVTTAKIVDSAVTTAKIAANAVTEAELDPSTVDGSTLEYAASVLEVPDRGVPVSKLATKNETTGSASAGDILLTNSSGAHSVSSSTYGDVTNLSGSITTTGRAVMIMVVSDGTSNRPQLSVGSKGLRIRIVRDSTDIAVLQPPYISDDFKIPATQLFMMDTPSAGTYTYKIQAATGAGSGTDSAVSYCKLFVMEI